MIKIPEQMTKEQGAYFDRLLALLHNEATDLRRSKKKAKTKKKAA